MELVLGRPGEPVSATDPRTAARLDAELQSALRVMADELAEQRGGVGGVLSSVSLLGRLDHIRMQLSDFPGEEE
jgi:hypothetical protein